MLCEITSIHPERLPAKKNGADGQGVFCGVHTGVHKAMDCAQRAYVVNNVTPYSALGHGSMH